MIAYEVGGALHPAMSDAAFLLRVGWTWRDLIDAPDEVVEKMLILLSAEAEVTKGKLEELKRG